MRTFDSRYLFYKTYRKGTSNMDRALCRVIANTHRKEGLHQGSFFIWKVVILRRSRRRMWDSGKDDSPFFYHPVLKYRSINSPGLNLPSWRDSSIVIKYSEADTIRILSSLGKHLSYPSRHAHFQIFSISYNVCMGGRCSQKTIQPAQTQPETSLASSSPGQDMHTRWNAII